MWGPGRVGKAKGSCRGCGGSVTRWDMVCCRGRVGRSVAEATLEIVGAGLSDTSSSGVFVTLIYGGLHLLKELINVHQVSLGAKVAHWG